MAKNPVGHKRTKHIDILGTTLSEKPWKLEQLVSQYLHQVYAKNTVWEAERSTGADTTWLLIEE